ncbi:MAG: RecX family transcriptional regulator [Actinobacteria bacterium]|nr:RecX family transcriptional regulator [Actinomycetota bacterium]
MKVELDGAPWRTVPVDVVLAAGLHVGLTLDRERLRILRRELRSREALSKAARLLARGDLSEQGLGAELEQRRVPPAARREAISRLLAAGAVNDERLATRRAELLAARGAGDALIRADLESRGLDPRLVGRALEGLDHEDERARKIVTARGEGPATARYLARKGFDRDAIETAVDGYVGEGG